MASITSLKSIGVGVAVLLLAGVVGYSLGNRTLVKSDARTTAAVVTTSSSSSSNSTASTSNSDYKYTDLKDKCVNALQDYATSIRNRAQEMAAKIRTEAAKNPDRSSYQPQIDELLTYVKTMQADMTKLNTCITRVDQKHDFSASELFDINSAIAASKK